MKKLRLTTLAALSFAVPMSGANAAERYVSLGLGIAEEQVEMNSLVPGFLNCQSLLVSSAAAVDFCGGPSSFEPSGAEFDLENALAGSASLGFEWEDWRLELEYSGREHGGRSLPRPALPLVEQFRGVDLGAVGGLVGIPSTNPGHEISRLNSQRLFVNAFYGFRTGVAWRPFVGLGVGVARIRYRYVLEGSELTFHAPDFLSVPALTSEEPLVPQLFAFSNRTVLDAESSDNVLGYQFMAGVDRELADRTSAFVTVRWSRFESSEVTNLAPGQLGPFGPLSHLLVISSIPRNLDDIGGVSLIAGIRFGF